MSKEKIPHVHAEVMKVWVDDMSTPIQWRSNNRDTWLDINNEPYWYKDFQYRVKPKEFPKSTLTYSQLCDLANEALRSDSHEGKATIVGRLAADAAVAEFIESGEMVKYFTNPDNGYITKGNF